MRRKSWLNVSRHLVSLVDYYQNVEGMVLFVEPYQWSEAELCVALLLLVTMVRC